MVENPSPGLSMVPGDVPVTVTREEHHQRVLSRYTVAPGGERHIAAELAWCTIGSGKYTGERGIEVRVDGHRAGELTHAMSQRYAPLLESGARVGCEATVTRTERGLQVTLQLPRNADAAFLTPPPTDPPTERFTHVRPIPATVVPARPAWRKPLWIGVAVVLGVFVLAGIFGGNEDDVPDIPVGAGETTATTTFEPPPTTTTTTTTTTTPPPPPPTTTEEPAVEPPPPPAPAPPPAPPPAPEPPSGCDPNYSGCVPIASDVDCAGGSGNGPAYVSGPVRVIGSDIYRLDNDDDGTACE